MKVLITGADGFVARNLQISLAERHDVVVLRHTRQTSAAELMSLVYESDFIFHLAGVNRPVNPVEFETNLSLAQSLADSVKATSRKIPLLYTSSIQAAQDNAYGNSKRAAEEVFHNLAAEHGSPVYLFRLPNVFGKWAKPYYNSAVATFCHNVARDLPIQINDPAAVVTLVYVDDVVEHLIAAMNGAMPSTTLASVTPQYCITVGELASQIRSFRGCRETLLIEPVGRDLGRALYATYVSYLPKEKLSYPIPKYVDERGVFVEMLKTQNSGQFSYFTARPGVTRGGHYHHTKTEKFLVVKGQACFRFRNIQTGEFHEIYTSGDHPQIVDTVPGWAHDISNVGHDEMLVMLWANETFDRSKPDTFSYPVGVSA